MFGPLTVEAPDGSCLTIQEVAGRGWRCCSDSRAPHYHVPLYATLRGALTDCVPGLEDDDAWLVDTLLRLSPAEVPSTGPR